MGRGDEEEYRTEDTEKEHGGHGEGCFVLYPRAGVIVNSCYCNAGVDL